MIRSQLLKDITCSCAVRLLIGTFYDGVCKDHMLGPLMDGELKKCLPDLSRFWTMVLIGESCRCQLQGNWPVSLKVSAGKFSRLIELFEDALDIHFEGPKAIEAKQKAGYMSVIFQNN